MHLCRLCGPNFCSDTYMWKREYCLSFKSYIPLPFEALNICLRGYQFDYIRQFIAGFIQLWLHLNLAEFRIHPIPDTWNALFRRKFNITEKSLVSFSVIWNSNLKNAFHVSGIGYTEKCRFMDKREREISRFFGAPPRAFPLSVRARPRTVLSTNTFSSVRVITVNTKFAYTVCH